MDKKFLGNRISDVENMLFPKLVLSGDNSTEFTLTLGDKKIEGEIGASESETVLIPELGTWHCEYTIGGLTKSKDIAITTAMTTVNETLGANVYGVAWDGTSSTSWTRTDKAANFVDPVPAVSSGNGSSPFDTLMPWSGMEVSERTAGKMVSIPKFWYKIEQTGDNGIKVQIADNEKAGFSVSPAHMDRGDGKGERDVVYIGRYHCATSTYKSTTGVKPVASITRSAARTSIHNLGTNIWQCDFAMRFTLWLLYIVEFADWNSQAKIGKGCGNNSATANMGYTDSMTYHTGTTQSSRDTYGLGTQYRHIEGLWDNVLDWTDGCYYDANGMNVILNPSNYSDTTGGTLVGSLTSGYPSQFEVKDSAPYPMMLPVASSGSDSTYSCDYWSYGSSGPCLNMGGSYSQSGYYGMLYVYSSGASYTYASIGSRLQELP